MMLVNSWEREREQHDCYVQFMFMYIRIFLLKCFIFFIFMCRFICSFQCEVLSFCIFVSSSTEQMFGSVEKICQVAVAGGGSGVFLFPNNNNNNNIKHCERLEMARKYGCVGKTNTHFEIAFVETFGSTTSMENAYFSSFFFFSFTVSIQSRRFSFFALCSIRSPSTPHASHFFSLHILHFNVFIMSGKFVFFCFSHFCVPLYIYISLLYIFFIRSTIFILFPVYMCSQHHHANAFLVQFRSLFTFAFVFPQPTLFSPACFAFFSI